MASIAVSACSGPDADEPVLRTRDAVRAAASSSSGLDATFGAGGTIVEPSVPITQGTMSLAVQSDGKILVETEVPSAIVRLTSTGALDTSFGGGIVSLPFIAESLTLQSDGKLLVVGVSPSGSTVVARYTAGGVADPSFGAAGQIQTTISADVALEQPNGQILVGGSVSGLPIVHKQPTTLTALERRNANGSLDTSFGKGGSVAVVAVGAVTAMGLESDGSVLVLDAQQVPSGPFVARFSRTGAQEALGVSGVVSPIVVAAAFPNVTFDPAGNILFAASAPGSPRLTSFGRIVRYTVHGTLDATFNGPVFDWGAGLPGTDNVPNAVITGENGKIVAGGVAVPSGVAEAFGFAAFAGNGALDTSFANDGLTSTTITGFDAIFALAVQADGKVLAGGFGGRFPSASLALARYLVP